jgi:hypothetical protein
MNKKGKFHKKREEIKKSLKMKTRLKKILVALISEKYLICKIMARACLVV